MKLLAPVALLLTVVGGLNWGLMALAQMDLVDTLFGSMPSVAKVVYILVGLSAVYVAVTMLPKQFSMPK